MHIYMYVCGCERVCVCVRACVCVCVCVQTRLTEFDRHRMTHSLFYSRFYSFLTKEIVRCFQNLFLHAQVLSTALWPLY